MQSNYIVCCGLLRNEKVKLIQDYEKFISIKEILVMRTELAVDERHPQLRFNQSTSELIAFFFTHFRNSKFIFNALFQVVKYKCSEDTFAFSI